MTEKEIIQKIYDIVVDSGYLNPEDTYGCNEKDLEVIRKYFPNGKIPEMYKQFMLKMGREIGGTYIGQYLTSVDFIDQNHENAKEAAKINEVELPENAYFFACEDAEIYLYIHTNEDNDNPPVYRFSMPKGSRMVYKSFLQFLQDGYGEAGADELL